MKHLFILCFSVFFVQLAQANVIKLSPGAQIEISPSEQTTIRCEGTVVNQGCTCVVGNSQKQEDIPCNTGVGYAVMVDGVAIYARGCWNNNPSGNKIALGQCRERLQAESLCQQ